MKNSFLFLTLAVSLISTASFADDTCATTLLLSNPQVTRLQLSSDSSGPLHWIESKVENGKVMVTQNYQIGDNEPTVRQIPVVNGRVTLEDERKFSVSPVGCLVEQ